MAKYRKEIIRCTEPGCDQPRFCYARCTAHFRQIDPALYERLKGMTRAERAAEFARLTAQPELPRWTYEGDEDSLARMVEQQEEPLQ